jgi:sugar diacid utilization regulator
MQQRGRAVSELRRPRYERLETWLEGVTGIAAAVTASEPLTALLDLIAATACKLMDYDFCAVLLADDARSVLTVGGSCGLSRDYGAKIAVSHPIRLGPSRTIDGPSSRAFHTRAAVAVEAADRDPTFRPWIGLAYEQGYRSMLCVPLLVNGEPVGTINCYLSRPHHFDAAEVHLLTALAGQAAIALETARLRDHERDTIRNLQELNASLRQQHALLEKAEAIHQRLTAVALRAGGIQAVAEALAELVARPVLIEDPALKALASVGYGGVTVQAPSEAERGAEVDHGRPQGVVQPQNLTELPAHQQSAAVKVWVSAPVLLDTELVARIWLPARLAELTELDRRAVEHAVIVCGLELLRERTAREVEWRLRGDLLAELLSHPADEQATLRERALNEGHDLSQPHVLLVSRLDESRSSQTPAVRATQVSRLLGLVRSLSTPDRRLLVTRDREHVIVLWPQGAGDTDPAEPYRAARRIRIDVERALAGESASVVVSVPYTDPADYAAAFRVGKGALQLARVQGRRNTTVTLEDLGLYGLLLQLDDTAELSRFADRTLALLRNHDRRRGAALVPTLRAYLSNGQDRSATAAELHLHPNTVGLRLKRIETVLGLSLQSPQALMQVTAALMVDDVLASRR